ncbi:MAG: DUF523 domain-containing protein [Deltaproteobacteria bacterium]|nr:DUF523 domain-containing protein [Candidatus Anaeroferrophillus wilburensis]MBN2888243.1 DUF523 domain-containing protein [Deltaproteobacteria bacterium]
MNFPLVVSACMMGIRCRYDGTVKTNERLVRFCREHAVPLVPLCPEQLGGLPTPRPAACFSGGDGSAVLRGNARLSIPSGGDVSDAFRLGAQQALHVAQSVGASGAILKEKSPSCGVHLIYCSDTLVAGCGVTTALFKENGLSIWTADEFIAAGSQPAGAENP